jgi:uncharacterized coiled-coil protein SlyX
MIDLPARVDSLEIRVTAIEARLPVIEWTQRHQGLLMVELQLEIRESRKSIEARLDQLLGILRDKP